MRVAFFSSLVVLFACVGDAPAVIAGSDSGTQPDTSTPPADASGDTAMMGTDAADAAPAWSPTDLDSRDMLALWLEGSSANLVVSSGQVETWYDLSKNHNDATNKQGGPAPEPGAINGHEAVHFVNVGLGINDSASLQFGGDQIYIAVVVKALASGGIIYSKAMSGFSGSGSYYKEGLQLAAGSSAIGDGGTGFTAFAQLNTNSNASMVWNGSIFGDGKFHILALRRSNSYALQMSVDEQPVQMAAIGGYDISEVGAGVDIAGTHYGNIAPNIDLDIAELLVLHGSAGVVGDPDVLSVQTYLRSKYAL